MNQRSLRIAVVGLGYWGPNLARNFAAIEDCELAWCCDPSAQALERIAGRFPQARLSEDLNEVLADPALDAVALATPVPSHAETAVRVLEAVGRRDSALGDRLASASKLKLVCDRLVAEPARYLGDRDALGKGSAGEGMPKIVERHVGRQSGTGERRPRLASPLRPAGRRRCLCRCRCQAPLDARRIGSA